MSSLKQNIRSVLADVETFLVETLKSVKLNSSAKDHKDRLLEKIRQLLDEIPGSASSYPDSNTSGGSLKISGGGDSGSGGTSSNNLQTLADEESGYADNIPKVAASDLKNKLQSGMLDKKKKSGFKTWEPLYCVVSGNIFYMYKKQGDSKQKEAFCLNGYEFQEAPGLEKDASKKEMCFEVTKADGPTYQFRAGSKEGMVIWKEAITKGTQITADDEPGGLYEKTTTYSEDAHRQYINLHQLPKEENIYEFGDDDDDDDEIYDDLDGIPYELASPVPRASTLPLPKKTVNGIGYCNLSSTEQQARKGSGDRASFSVKPKQDSPSVISMFKESSGEERRVLPSQIKKIMMTETNSGPLSVGSKQQNQPPMIDIYKESKEEASPSIPEWKKGNGTATSRISVPAGNSENRKVTAKQTDPKSPSANPNKGRSLPPPPTAGNPAGSKVEQMQKKGGRPPSPQSPKSPDPSSSCDSPPPQGPGVRNLKTMFEK